MAEKHKCWGQARPAGSWYSAACRNTAKVERDGKWYCGMHDPVRIAERRATQNAKWDAEWNARVEAERKAKEARKAQERDGARLDYMENVKPITFCPSSKDDDWYLYPDYERPDVCFRAKTLREAIDQAMQEKS